jgi:hypothetical protein
VVVQGKAVHLRKRRMRRRGENGEDRGLLLQREERKALLIWVRLPDAMVYREVDNDDTGVCAFS